MTKSNYPFVLVTGCVGWKDVLINHLLKEGFNIEDTLRVDAFIVYGTTKKQATRFLPLAKDAEVRLADETIDFGTGPETVQVFYPKNKLISKEQRERAERDYERRKQ